MGKCDTIGKLVEINCLPFEDTTNFDSIASYLSLATRF